MNNILKKIFHDFLGWHKPAGWKEFDGCGFVSVCKVCKKHILQDSQGNWFEIGRV